MTQKKLSRRDFLKTAGIALGASALTCSGLGYLATLPPEFDMIDTSLGEQDAMSKKILITYATKGQDDQLRALLGALRDEHIRPRQFFRDRHGRGVQLNDGDFD